MKAKAPQHEGLSSSTSALGLQHFQKQPTRILSARRFHVQTPDVVRVVDVRELPESDAAFS